MNLKLVNPSFNLVYTSIREENTQRKGGAEKSELGKMYIVTDIEGNGFHKFIFDREIEGKPRLLIKTFTKKETVENLKFLKFAVDTGIDNFKYSPFPYAIPIGYEIFEKETYKKLGKDSLIDVPFTVYIFKEDCEDLSSVFENDDEEDIFTNNHNFDYAKRKMVADKLIDLYSIIENINLRYNDCDKYQILHYDIKPSNYLIDKYEDIFFIDFDQSGLYSYVQDKFIYRPIANISTNKFLFLPAELLYEKGNFNANANLDLWYKKELYTERWMSWLLLFRILTGLRNPFRFYDYYEHDMVYSFIKSNSIRDIFSEKAYTLGNCFHQVRNEQDRKKYLQNLMDHFDKGLTFGLKEMMNDVFLKGFYDFSLRPSFFKYNYQHSKYLK